MRRSGKVPIIVDRESRTAVRVNQKELVLLRKPTVGDLNITFEVERRFKLPIDPNQALNLMREHLPKIEDPELRGFLVRIPTNGGVEREGYRVTGLGAQVGINSQDREGI